MKTMLFAASALFLGLAAGSAYAGEGGPIANTEFTEFPGVIAHSQVQVPPVASAQLRQATSVYGTTSSHGTWLFAPQDGGGANS